jgi:hypothetical protein
MANIRSVAIIWRHDLFVAVIVFPLRYFAPPCNHHQLFSMALVCPTNPA